MVETAMPSNSHVASAVRYAGTAARVYAGAKEWQREAYRHYAICGEARFAANYFGQAMSKVTLFAATATEDGFQKVEAGSLAEVALSELFNGSEGQEQMLAAIGTHLTIAGECYIVGRTVEENAASGVTGGDVWEVVSVLEMKVAGSRWSLVRGEGKPDLPLTDDDVVIRIWRSLPGERMEADSPFRSLLPILSEIEWLTKHIFSQASSRLAGAGILFLSEDMTFPPPPEGEEGGQPTNAADAMMRTLAEAMLEPLENDGSPASVVPIVVTGPADAIDKARLMHFWSDLDQNSQAMRQAALVRFALGMDLPPEQILGMSSNAGSGGGTSNGVSHWGAWQIEEATIKMHIEPMLALITAALTISYLRIQTDGDEVVRANTAALRLRPDRSAEAIQLWDRGLLSDEALLREVGFSERDLPTPEQQRIWMLRKIATGSATPEQVAAALKALGVDLAIAAPADPGETREARPAPSLEALPSRDIPEAASAVLLAACVPLVFRALERAGNRMRSAGTTPPGVPAYETHTLVSAQNPAYLLADAWSCAPQALDGIADADRVVPMLDAYCRTLLAEQVPHSRERLSAWLARVDLPCSA